MLATILAGLGVGAVVGKTIFDAVTDSKNVKIQKDNFALQEANFNYLKGVQQKLGPAKIMQFNAVSLI